MGKGLRCVICRGKPCGPVSLTPEFHEMYCIGCGADLRTWPGFSVVIQLVDLGRKGDALSQYRHVQESMRHARRAA